MFKPMSTPALAIIGMGVTGVNLENYQAFGFQVFHGREHIVPEVKGAINNLDLEGLIGEVTRDMHFDIGDMGIITISNKSGSIHGWAEICQSARFHLDLNSADTNPWIEAFDYLENRAADAVLILEECQVDHEFDAILVCTQATAEDSGVPVFGLISVSAVRDQSTVTDTLDDLLRSLVDSESIDLNTCGLLLTSKPLDTAVEMLKPQVLRHSFGSLNEKSCAISGGNSGLRSVLKAIWCLTHRLIPGTSDWQKPVDPMAWQHSPFYIPAESRNWFTSANKPIRKVVVINQDNFGFESIVVLREGCSNQQIYCTCVKQEPAALLPIGGDTIQDLLTNLTDVSKSLQDNSDLGKLSMQQMARFNKGQRPDRLVVCLIGEDNIDFIREINFALKGLPKAFEHQSEWRTPKGSYFTSRPLGDSGEVSFVYPGAFNSYVGIGKDLFYFYPYLLNKVESLTQNLGDLMYERMLYPREISALSNADVAEVESQLNADPLAMLISGISLSMMLTLLLRDIFGVNPASAFGYSLGEISMMFANGFWTQVDESSEALLSSPLFSTRLAGPQNAIREVWNLPASDSEDFEGAIWENYVLMASPAEVRAAMANESRVFMTHINTPNQVVIGGNPSAVRRIISDIKCNSLQAPFNYAIHCDAMQSEFNEFKKLLSWPVSNQTEIALYSAAHYQAMPFNQAEIAENIAHGLCHQLDFTQLIQKAYSDGARIFIELGAGGNCTRWINETLKDAPHAAFSTNRKGLNDHAAVLQILARLISQRVPVNLSTFIG